MTGKNEGGNNVFIYWEQVFNCASQESFPDSVEGRWCLNHFKLAKLPDLLSPQIYFLHLFLLHVSNITSLCCDIKKISHAFIKANTLQGRVLHFQLRKVSVLRNGKWCYKHPQRLSFPEPSILISPSPATWQQEHHTATWTASAPHEHRSEPEQPEWKFNKGQRCSE